MIRHVRRGLVPFVLSWLLFAASLAVPAVSLRGDLIGGTILGWRTFPISFLYDWQVWPDFSGNIPGVLLMTVLAFANGMFLQSPALFFKRALRGTVVRLYFLLPWIAAGASLSVLWPVTRRTLQPGFYLWAGSFVLLAAGFRRRFFAETAGTRNV